MSDESRPDNLPDGVIDSAPLFFAMIREKAAMDQTLVDDAIRFLEAEYVETMRKIDAGWEINGRRYGMAFWTGARLGARIAWRRYLMHLRAADFEAKRGAAPAE